jgi:CRISPR/Cas system-associated exonuclease Cas4 (RecB family)
LLERETNDRYKHNLVHVDELPSFTNEETGERRYQAPSGLWYPSVTTILKPLSEPFLVAWRKRVGEDVAEQIGHQARVRGTAIHNVLERYLMNENDVLNSFDNMMLKALKPLLAPIDNIRCIEGSLYSDYMRCAGRTDCIADYDGKVSIIDFKTSKRIKDEGMIGAYFMQTAAYAVMFEERTGIPVNQTVIIMYVDGEYPLIFKSTRDKYIKQFIAHRNSLSI